VADALTDGATFASDWIAHGFTFAVDTGVCARTFFVDGTSGLETALERIASVTFRTSANRFVCDNTALGGRSAVARFFADSVATGLFGRTRVISGASSHLISFWNYCRHTSAVLIQEAVSWTLTDDRAQRQAVHHAAELSFTAWNGTARIDAFVVDANFAAGTFRIRATFRTRWAGRWYDSFDTTDVRVSTHFRRTVTNGLMFSAFTRGARSARDRLADFDADSVQSVADFVGGAIIVTLASDRNADDGGVALHSGRAVALGTMKDYTAEGVGSALISTEDARVQTFAGDTSAV